jgi:hypothetical protein
MLAALLKISQTTVALRLCASVIFLSLADDALLNHVINHNYKNYRCYPKHGELASRPLPLDAPPDLHDFLFFARSHAVLVLSRAIRVKTFPARAASVGDVVEKAVRMILHSRPMAPMRPFLTAKRTSHGLS